MCKTIQLTGISVFIILVVLRLRTSTVEYVKPKKVNMKVGN
jgi:hypothetical protein